ncbi:hypothetical protein SAMN05444339_102428 [Loktanella atrilutea]|uniref:Uncharacterized protein n=1 Tax=Loktanella atrilutea TaxID=366533 RepID=A0A1M4XC26_LOKAT|nr:hypothetical protein [Loktanella atrilutea]SHE91068.1 hypothetical protein SAMN05444339_102428 [Loktanella atrilutea]
MHRALLSLVMFSSIFLLFAGRSLAAARPCLPTPEMEAALERSFQEFPLAIAMMPDGSLLTLYASAHGTWTMTLQRPDESACIVVAGEDLNLLHRGGLVPERAT